MSTLSGWKEEYKRKLVTAEEAAAQVKSGDWVAVPPVNSVPIDILNALAARKEEIQDVKIAGSLLIYPFVFLGGDYIGKITYFCAYGGPLERMFYKQGNVIPSPVHLSKSCKTMAVNNMNDVAMFEVTPPDERGYMNYSLCGVAYGRYIANHCKKVVAQVNAKAPWIHGIENTIHISEIDYIVEKDHEIPTIPEIEITEVEKKIGGYIAERIPDGATVQLGIGSIPNAVAYFLHEKKDLGIHTEILSDAVTDLVERGVITGRKKTIYKDKITVGGAIIGTKKLNDFCNDNPTILSMPIHLANDFDTIRNHDNMCSINSALTVDLTGQIASETIGHSIYSATGGQADFVRGALAARNGMSFIALPSTGKNKDGSLISRIVLNFEPGTVVTTPRSDAMYIVTEYGLADLYLKCLPDRVRAMISIAHPDFREDLERQAFEAGLLPAH